MKISCAFPPAVDLPRLVELAEQLGFERAWLYDAPPVYPDVWMILARCAERTTRIGLGPGVLVPSTRHPMVNAAAIATLESMAPGRVAVAIGAGFSARVAMGQRPIPWADVAHYVRTLRSLLHGDEVEWEGKAIQMLHLPGFGAPRPVMVPFLIGADGPLGLSVAAELGAGVFSVAVPQPDAGDGSPWRAVLSFGTVLDDGETIETPRVEAALSAPASVLLHTFYERNGAAAVDTLPGGVEWRAAVEAVPPRTRHLAVHRGHLVEANSHDRIAVSALLPVAEAMALVGRPPYIRQRLAELDAAGVTEIAYQPAGPDLERELRAFAAATLNREED